MPVEESRFAPSDPGDSRQRNWKHAGDAPPRAEPSVRYEHYEVLRQADGSVWELGRGAMGVTYRALDTRLRHQVALKVISGGLTG